MAMTAKAKKFRKVRLHKIVKELNLTTDTIVNYLTEHGYASAVKGDGINAAITDEDAYLELKEHFAEDPEKRAHVQEIRAERESHLSDLDGDSIQETPEVVQSVSSQKADVVSDSDWWLYPEELYIRSRSIDRICCFAYRFAEGWDNDWSVRINEFKKGEKRDVRKAEMTLRAAAPSLFKSIGTDPELTIVIPILGSEETSATAHSKNSRLAKAIADGVNVQLTLDCLSKNKNPPLHKEKGLSARRKALLIADYKASKLDDKFESVVIVDDIVTSGMTMGFVATAILQSNPGVKIIGFALGRHLRTENLPVSFEKANTHIPNELAEIWDQA